MFNEINKVSEVCVVNARNVIYNSSLSRLMYNLSVCMRLLTKWCCVVEFEPLKFPSTTWEANWYWSPLANRFKCFMGVYCNGGYDKPANGQDDISSLVCSDKLGGVSVTMSTDLIFLISTLIFSIKCWDWFKMLINASHSLTVLPPSSPNLRQYSKLSFTQSFIVFNWLEQFKYNERSMQTLLTSAKTTSWILLNKINWSMAIIPDLIRPDTRH